MEKKADWDAANNQGGVEMRKGMNALETIFMLFILIIVVVVIVQMFTKFTSAGQAKLGASLKQVEKVSGYKAAIQTCQNACSDYKATGNDIDIIDFCTKSVSMDIDFSGKSDSGEPTVSDLERDRPVMLAPIGYVVCEKNIYCPQLIECNNRYDLDECLTKLCRYYYNKYRTMPGYNKEKALSKATDFIKGMYQQGDCDIDDIVSEGSNKGIPDINWHKLYIGKLDCAERLGIEVSSSGSGSDSSSSYKFCGDTDSKPPCVDENIDSETDCNNAGGEWITSGCPSVLGGFFSLGCCLMKK